jgi:hypothetical protein
VNQNAGAGNNWAKAHIHKGFSRIQLNPLSCSGLCSKLRAPNRGTPLGSCVCGAQACSLCSLCVRYYYHIKIAFSFITFLYPWECKSSNRWGTPGLCAIALVRGRQELVCSRDPGGKFLHHLEVTALLISPTHKRTEGRAPVWGSEFMFTSKYAIPHRGPSRNRCWAERKIMDFGDWW